MCRLHCIIMVDGNIFSTFSRLSLRVDANATVPRGFLSLPMLSRCTHLGIARAAPPCTSGSANDRRRTRVIAMHRQGIGTSRKISMYALKFSPDVSTPNTIGDISPNSAEQSANMSQTHRRPIGDTSAMLVLTSAMHILCDNIADGLVIHRQSIADVPELLGEASAVLRRCFAKR